MNNERLDVARTEAEVDMVLGRVKWEIENEGWQGEKKDVAEFKQVIVNLLWRIGNLEYAMESQEYKRGEGK